MPRKKVEPKKTFLIFTIQGKIELEGGYTELEHLKDATEVVLEVIETLRGPGIADVEYAINCK